MNVELLQAMFHLVEGEGEVDARSSRLTPDLNAPLSLGYTEAVQRAIQLRRRGREWSWPVIAAVMGEYHGFWRSAGWWSREVKARIPDRRLRGGAFVSGDNRAFRGGAR